MKTPFLLSSTLCAGTFVALTLGLGMPASAAAQAAGAPSCRPAVQALTSEWDAIGYPEPSKPMQAHVVGRLGHENSGGEVNYMRVQLREAVQDCDLGRDEPALHRVAAIRALLDHINPTE